jgi:hypothetical protein
MSTIKCKPADRAGQKVLDPRNYNRLSAMQRLSLAVPSMAAVILPVTLGILTGRAAGFERSNLVRSGSRRRHAPNSRWHRSSPIHPACPFGQSPPSRSYGEEYHSDPWCSRCSTTYSS